jgi:hypothetical protein
MVRGYQLSVLYRFGKTFIPEGKAGVDERRSGRQYLYNRNSLSVKKRQ